MYVQLNLNTFDKLNILQNILLNICNNLNVFYGFIIRMHLIHCYNVHIRFIATESKGFRHLSAVWNIIIHFSSIARLCNSIFETFLK